MGFYRNQIVPMLTDLAMRQRDLAAYRSRVIPAADGRVLEIGVGSGLNLPFYSPKVRHLIGLDPSSKLLSMARRNSSPNSIPIELIEASAVSMLPFSKGMALKVPRSKSAKRVSPHDGQWRNWQLID
jgi:ubiquinone/menaquinone biosynthesis C-methylase UbiE